MYGWVKRLGQLATFLASSGIGLSLVRDADSIWYSPSAPQFNPVDLLLSPCFPPGQEAYASQPRKDFPEGSGNYRPTPRQTPYFSAEN